MDQTMRVRLLGVRGTVPVHGSDYALFGGATSCVLVEAAGRAFVLDAGTGLLNRSFYEFFSERRVTLLVSHPHVDHLLSLPAFGPLFDDGYEFDVYLRTRAGLTAREQFERLMAPPLWPVGPDVFRARVAYHDVPASFSVGEARVDTMESVHPGGSTIYKISCGDASLVYATDFEPASDAPQDFCDFARGCSLLLLDAQYTTEEYVRTRGFGHSTIERSVAIAEACGAEQTILVHHDPKRTDVELAELDRSLRRDHPTIHFGREDEEVTL